MEELLLQFEKLKELGTKKEVEDIEALSKQLETLSQKVEKAYDKVGDEFDPFGDSATKDSDKYFNLASEQEEVETELKSKVDKFISKYSDIITSATFDETIDKVFRKNLDLAKILDSDYFTEVCKSPMLILEDGSAIYHSSSLSDLIWDIYKKIFKAENLELHDSVEEYFRANIEDYLFKLIDKFNLLCFGVHSENFLKFTIGFFIIISYNIKKISSSLEERLKYAFEYAKAKSRRFCALYKTNNKYRDIEISDVEDAISEVEKFIK